MKREIKFRGKRIDNGEWVYGDLVINKVSSSYRIASDFALCQNAKYTEDQLHHVSGEIYLVDPKTVGQYTGLKDSNGVEIYEGDVICWPYEEDTPEHVEYNEDWGAFETSECGLQGDDIRDGKVIGNIHENK